MSSLDWNRRLSIAPMLDWTDRHERFFLRSLSRHVLLYTEMVVTHALLHAGPERFLRYHPCEHPVALQLGGSDPKDLARCARMAEEAGFDEINLNCGCPSDRVQSGSFGACLMDSPALVADCVKAMKDAVSIPVTVKTRIGIDHQDHWDFFWNLITTVRQAGCDHWIIHARKAWLKGLSPRENRERPPLNYATVWRLKELLGSAQGVSLNGGVRDLSLVEALLNGQETHPGYAVPPESTHQKPIPLDGVMVGREAYENPWFLQQVDERLYGEKQALCTDRRQYLESLLPYIEKQQAQGVPLHHMTRHLTGLFNGVRGARRYRQWMAEKAAQPGAGIEVIQQALEAIVT